MLIISCNGDHDKMTYAVTSLTWLEEWLMYYDILWGKTIIRWIDVEKEYKMHGTLCLKVFDTKLALVVCCRSSWPRWVSHSEDCYLRKQKWSDKYEGKRVVMWDDTNVNLQFKTSSADTQRTTYSAYYGGNVCK